MAIDDLISPLRYDILVRQQYFSFLDANSKLTSDIPRLVERSLAEPYYAWFERVVVPRFHPRLVGDPTRIRAGFARRVTATVELWESFSRRGFDPSRPITVETGRRIGPTATGKLLARRLYPGDGCHRLAWLRARGTSTLEPGAYLVRTRRRLTPLDNTTPLLGPLEVDLTAYRRFLALSYGDLASAAGEPSAAAREATGLRGELARVAAIDVPLLTAGSDDAG